MSEANQKPNEQARGSGDEQSEPRFLVIGEIIKPHGVRGEVRVAPYTDLPERFGWLEVVYLGEEDPEPVAVEAARPHQNWVLVKLAGYDDRDAAESLRGTLLQVALEDAIPLEEDEYFLYELEGMAVYTEEGEHLGELTEVIETKANNVFLVSGGQREVLLPDIDEVILEIDLEQRRMTVRLLPGLLST